MNTNIRKMIETDINFQDLRKFTEEEIQLELIKLMEA